eukprot:g1158.t1
MKRPRKKEFIYFSSANRLGGQRLGSAWLSDSCFTTARKSSEQERQELLGSRSSHRTLTGGTGINPRILRNRETLLTDSDYYLHCIQKTSKVKLSTYAKFILRCIDHCETLELSSGIPILEDLFVSACTHIVDLPVSQRPRNFDALRASRLFKKLRKRDVFGSETKNDNHDFENELNGSRTYNDSNINDRRKRTAWSRLRKYWSTLLPFGLNTIRLTKNLDHSYLFALSCLLEDSVRDIDIYKLQKDMDTIESQLKSQPPVDLAILSRCINTRHDRQKNKAQKLKQRPTTNSGKSSESTNSAKQTNGKSSPPSSFQALNTLDAHLLAYKEGQLTRSEIEECFPSKDFKKDVNGTRMKTTKRTSSSSLETNASIGPSTGPSIGPSIGHENAWHVIMLKIECPLSTFISLQNDFVVSISHLLAKLNNPLKDTNHENHHQKERVQLLEPSEAFPRTLYDTDSGSIDNDSTNMIPATMVLLRVFGLRNVRLLWSYFAIDKSQLRKRNPKRWCYARGEAIHSVSSIRIHYNLDVSAAKFEVSSRSEAKQHSYADVDDASAFSGTKKTPVSDDDNEANLPNAFCLLENFIVEVKNVFERYYTKQTLNWSRQNRVSRRVEDQNRDFMEVVKEDVEKLSFSNASHGLYDLALLYLRQETRSLFANFHNAREEGDNKIINDLKANTTSNLASLFSLADSTACLRVYVIERKHLGTEDEIRGERADINLGDFIQCFAYVVMPRLIKLQIRLASKVEESSAPDGADSRASQTSGTILGEMNQCKSREPNEDKKKKKDRAAPRANEIGRRLLQEFRASDPYCESTTPLDQVNISLNDIYGVLERAGLPRVETSHVRRNILRSLKSMEKVSKDWNDVDNFPSGSVMGHNITNGIDNEETLAVSYEISFDQFATLVRDVFQVVIGD